MLYDVSSSYVEGRCCALARFGHSRDGRHDRMQIVFGLPAIPQRSAIRLPSSRSASASNAWSATAE